MFEKTLPARPVGLTSVGQSDKINFGLNQYIIN
jgi:hypothetical protein